MAKPQVDLYLPDEPDLPKVPKQWIVNVCAAVLGDDFKEWVYAQIEERNALMAEKKEIMISMDPMMASKFSASTHVSRKYNPVWYNLMIIICCRCKGYLCEYAQDEQQTQTNSSISQGRQGGRCPEGRRRSYQERADLAARTIGDPAPARK